MKNDFRHYCLVSLFSLDEIDNWSVERIGKAEKTSLILGISELMLNLTPFKVIVAEWTKLTDKHASSDGAKFVNAILDNISKNHEFT